jgi:nitroreductase
MEKPAPTERPIAPLLARRWSARAFDPNKPVDPELMMRLFEAARWAPSCFNEQPWRYLWFESADALEKARGCLTPGNAWAKSAPVLLLSIARESFRKNGKPNRWAQHDVGAASVSLALEAAELGLYVHQMAGYDADKTRELFGIAPGETPLAMIAVGWPGDPATLPEEKRAAESGPRKRDPIDLRRI